MAADRHLGFVGRLGTYWDDYDYLVVSITVQSLVEIDAIVSIIWNFSIFCPFGLKMPNAYACVPTVTTTIPQMSMPKPQRQHTTKSRVYEKVPEGSTLIFVDTRISWKHSVLWLVERSLHAKKQTNPFIPSARTPTCDRHRQTWTRTKGHS